MRSRLDIKFGSGGLFADGVSLAQFCRADIALPAIFVTGIMWARMGHA
jgi:hypothetical protein